MEIKDSYKKIIIDEINFAVKRMNSAKNASEKLYYFSAIYGVFHRIYNLDYNPDLVYAHFILRGTHEAFMTRLKIIEQARDHIILLSNEQFDKLSILSKELARKINKTEDMDETLKKFVTLSYSTTGNGYYLMQKGCYKL
jgi:hypothetical protein